MNTVITLVLQTLTMFLLAAVGYVLFRTGKITPDGNKVLGNLLIHISLPCVIINSFIVERTVERMLGLLASALGAAVILAVSILCARVGKGGAEMGDRVFLEKQKSFKYSCFIPYYL